MARRSTVELRTVAAVLLTIAAVVLTILAVRPRGTGSSWVYADARNARLGSGPGITSYPWADEGNPKAADPWGFPKRQCTSFVAWYLNSHGVPFAERTEGPGGVGTFGNASTWATGASAAGFVVSTKPAIGSIAQWRSAEPWHPGSASASPANACGSGGHVAVVLSVHSDGRTVDVAHYDGHTREFDIRPVWAPRYLYIGVA